VQRAWQLFHAGSYREAVVEGLKVGGAGLTCANKAQALYANYLARDERDRLALWLQVAVRAREQRESDPAAFNAWFFEAYALGRYAQQSGVAQALRLAPRIRRGFEETLRLAPARLDARTARPCRHQRLWHSCLQRQQPGAGAGRDGRRRRGGRSGDPAGQRRRAQVRG
jgi:hypothetical protein